MPAPEIFPTERGRDEIPYLKVIEARMFKRNILYFLFFLHNRMVFVRLGKSSFLVDNQYQIRRGIYGIIILPIVFGIFVPGAAFYYEYILGNQPNRDAGELGFLDTLLIAFPVLVGYVYFVTYVEEKLRLAISAMQENKILSTISKKDFNEDELNNFTDINRDIYYSDVSSVYIEETDRVLQRYSEENSKGYLMFELTQGSEHTLLGKRSSHNNLSNKFIVYNIPKDEDILKFEVRIKNFLVDKMVINNKNDVSNLGYTVRRERRLDFIMLVMRIAGGVGWGIAIKTLIDEKLYNESIILSVGGIGLFFLFLYIFRGRYWYKPNYFLYWSEKKRQWHSKFASKLLIIFVIATAIGIICLYQVYWTGPESIFVKKQQQEQPRLMSLLSSADKFYSEGKYENALALYDRALEINPHNLDALYNKGNTLYSLSRYEEAVIWYDKSLAIEPDDNNIRQSKLSAVYQLRVQDELDSR
jgi:tetratricopeptide (TPR) repeat protein